MPRSGPVDEAYQVFYGTARDFLQTIIDLYLSFELADSGYTLHLYWPCTDFAELPSLNDQLVTLRHASDFGAYLWPHWGSI